MTRRAAKKRNGHPPLDRVRHERCRTAVSDEEDENKGGEQERSGGKAAGDDDMPSDDELLETIA